ncbi:MAG: response regulator, partial [Deltaproteobacteria bacterium]|nr:response regulator [Deltaproteobacteria bacterium]
AIARVRAKIGVVVADDTEVGRRLIARALDVDPDFEIVEAVADGRAAVEAAERRRPRLVLLDVLLPRLDAPEATRTIMQRAPTRVVILTRDADPRSATAALEATRAGALDVLLPPAFGDPMAAPAVTFRDRLKELAEVPVVRRWYAEARRSERPSEARAARPADDARPAGAKMVAICGSTGGPAVLAGLLARLAPHVGGASVLIVQHVLEGFSAAFAEWLAEAARVPVRVAKDGDALEPGAIAIAPDGRHLAVASRTRVSVVDSPPVEAHRPSGTILFESVARTFGAEAIGVILTGMGRDGVAGLRTLRASGGLVLAQSPETCVVPGMPAAAIEESLAHLVVSPEDMADEIVARLARPG